MADVRMWQEKEVREAFTARAQARLEELQPEVVGREGVLAIEPESGDYLVGATLGKANSAAFEDYPDTWVYFVRLDDPGAAIALPTW
jgi:hypothetical protein